MIMRLRDPSGEAARDYQTRRRIVTPTRRCFQIVPVIICLLVVVPRLASAQDTEKLAARIPRMVIDNALENLDIFLGLAIPIDVDEESLLQQIAFTVPLTKTISSQLSSFPLGSSAGGFSWTFDPALGTFDRVSDSFGPVFAERALTVGRGRVNLGVNYQRATFDKFEGVDLDDGIKVYSGSPVVFIQDSLHMKLSTDTLGIFGTYGITDRIDVGVAVPIVRTELDARISGLVFTSSGQFSDAPIERASTSGTASGLGDIVVRGKYNFWSRPGGGLAAGIDVRLPTGDELDLLGVAGSQTKVYAAMSTASARVSPHFNIGYTISGKSEAAKSDDQFVFGPSDELNYAGGVDAAITKRLTVVGDLVGRTLRDFDKAVETTTVFGSAYTQFDTVKGNLNQLLGSVGVKFNPFGQSLVAINVLFPLDDHGLRDNLTWLVGFEQSIKFGKK